MRLLENQNNIAVLNEKNSRGGRIKFLHRTEPAERTDKTVAPLLLQHLADVAHAADGELIIVEFVP